MTSSGQNFALKLIGGGILVVGVYQLGLKPLLIKAGLMSGPEDEKIKEFGKSKAMDRFFFLTKPKDGRKTVMSSANATGFTWAVLDAMKWSAGTVLENWLGLEISPNDFIKLMGTFRSLKTQAMVSQLVDRYYTITGGLDLFTALAKKLDKSQVAEIATYVLALPEYYWQR